MTSIDALAGIAAIDAANEAEGGGADSGGWDFNQVSALTGSPTGSTSLDNISVLNVGPTVGLYNKKNVATAATSEGLYRNRRAAMKAAGVSFWDKPAYEAWDAKTRALMGVKKGDKFSSGQWMQAFGQMTPDQINEAAGNIEYYLDDTPSMGTTKKNAASFEDKQIARALAQERLMAGTAFDDPSGLGPAQVGWAGGAGNLWDSSAVTSSALGLDNLSLLGGGQGWNNPNAPPHAQAVPQGGTMSMSPYAAPSFEEYEARFSQSGSKPGQFTRSFLGAGPQDVTAEVMGVLRTTPNISDEFMRAITVNGYPNLVIDKMPSGVGAQYHSSTDTVSLGEDWTLGDLVHELAHRAVMTNTPGLDKIQMPNVQALYEVGGNALTPGYGAQGEMVTSRAATAQNLIDAQQHGWFSGMQDAGTSGIGGWADDYGTYDFDKKGFDFDYMKAMTQSPTDNPLDHAAIKAGWTATTPLNPMAEGMQQYHTAHPTYSVPGTGNWKGGYENWMASQSEMPNINYGAAYDSEGNIFGPASTTKNWAGGLWNAPMQGAHALIQEFVLRNKDMLEEGIYSPDARQAMYNKFVAEELGKSPEEKTTTVLGAHGAPHTITSSDVAYAPTSKISLIEKYNLAQEFWEKVGAYWDGFDQYMDANRSPYLAAHKTNMEPSQ